MEWPKNKHFSWLRLIPLIILLLGLGAFFYFRAYEYINLETLKAHRAQLLEWTMRYPIIIAGSFILIYTIAVAISMPQAIFLTLLGGFLFGPIFGTIYVAVGATIGATIIFLAAKTAFHKLLLHKAGPWMKKITSGFQNNAISYMLFLRLVPLFPFWLVNIVPAFLGISTRIYFFTTFFGILPGTFVYILLGHGLGTIIEQGKEINLGIIFKPEILAPLIGLGILSLIPIVYKKFKGKAYG
jgi:uncharacterized membrane protein YdjX (TVP38/TMEM64 family)